MVRHENEAFYFAFELTVLQKNLASSEHMAPERDILSIYYIEPP
jgi:hypothetical protein